MDNDREEDGIYLQCDRVIGRTPFIPVIPSFCLIVFPVAACNNVINQREDRVAIEGEALKDII
jgi:hypothetical protein